jgi:hypothetical protein
MARQDRTEVAEATTESNGKIVPSWDFLGQPEEAAPIERKRKTSALEGSPFPGWVEAAKNQPGVARSIYPIRGTEDRIMRLFRQAATAQNVGLSVKAYASNRTNDVGQELVEVRYQARVKKNQDA